MLLSLNFFNKNNDLIAQVSENFWTVYTDTIWDLVYKSKELTIWNKPRDISFSVKIENGEIFLRGTFYFKGFPVEASPQLLTVNGNRFMGFSMSNARIGMMISGI